MQNEPIISSGNQNPNSTSFNALPKNKKSLNPKVLGISLGVLTLVIVTVVVFVLPLFSNNENYFNENARATGSVETPTRYANLENYNLSFDRLSDFDEKDLQEKIVYFFAYTYPKITSLTVSDAKTYTETPAVETAKSTDPEDTEKPISYPVTEFNLSANTGEKFIIKVAEPEGPYSLTIMNHSGKELYSYSGDSITTNPYQNQETSSLLDAIAGKLPYSSKTSSNIEFDVSFGSDAENRLSITAKDENKTLSESECGEIKNLVVEWANGLNINDSKDITAEDFVCE